MINPDQFKKMLDLMGVEDNPVFDELFDSLKAPDRETTMVHAAILPANVLDYKINNTPSLQEIRATRGEYAARTAAQLEALGVYIWSRLDFDSELVAELFEAMARDVRRWHRSEEERESDRFIAEMVEAETPNDISSLFPNGDN